MKLITQAQFNVSHSAVLKILEYHNWSAAEHIWSSDLRGMKYPSQFTMQKCIMKNLNHRAVWLLLLKGLLSKWLQRAKVSCSYYFLNG